MSGTDLFDEIKRIDEIEVKSQIKKKLHIQNYLIRRYYGEEKNIEYLPLGDDDDFEWQKNYFNR